MTWLPISNAPLQYQDNNSVNYGSAVLKFYSTGTTTPITIAADSSGTTTAADAPLDSAGYATISGNKSIIYVQEAYKMALYPDQCSADSDIGAVWTIDGINPGFSASYSDLTVTTYLDVNGHLTIGAGADPGTSGDNVIVIENGTPPSTSTANTIQLYSVDLTAGNTIPAIFTEGTPLSGGTTQVGTMAIKLNGTTQYLLTSQTAGAGQTFNGITLVEWSDTVYTITDGASVDIDPANGGIQLWTLEANRTPTSSIGDGQRVRLGINDGASAYGVTWTTIGVIWSNSAPTLATSGYTWVDLWGAGGNVYGSVINT